MTKTESPFSDAERHSLNSAAPIPLYHQLYRLLRQRILSGSLAHGQQLPPEQNLAHDFNVSRITTKRVMEMLTKEGLVDRRRGRGSYVTYRPKSNVKVPMIGLLEKLVVMSRSTKIRVLQIAQQLPPPNIAEEMGLADHEKVHYAVRVRSDEDGRPFAYYESWTVGIHKSYTAQHLSEQLRLELLQENGLRLAHVHQYLSAMAATAEVARELEMLPGDPVLKLLRHSHDLSGRLVDLLHCQYHPERFHYRMDMDASQIPPST